MKKIVYSSLLISLIIVASSCTKTLDIKNPNELDASNFWQSGDDAVLGVNSIYGNNYRNGLYPRWFGLLYDPRSDDGWGSSGWDQIFTVTNFQTTNYDAEPINHAWAHLYRGIFRANQVLAYVPPIVMDEALKKRCLAEAKFWRGTYYFNLVTLWNNVPLVLQPSLPTDLPSQATPENVWTQVETDLSEAVGDLPASYAGDEANIGRITKGAAYAMLARVYMQQHKWQQAHDALQWLVEGDGRNIYHLMTNYADNFSAATENNAESVLEINFKAQQSVTDEDDPNSNLGNQREPFFAPSPPGFNDLEMHRWVIYEFEKEKTVLGQRDPRLAVTAIFDSTDVRGPYYSVFWGKTFAQLLSPQDKRCWYRKYENDQTSTGITFEGEKNFRVIRYADVLLMYAECLNELDQTAVAYTYVNQVRNRAGLANLEDVMPNMTQVQFRAQLEHERITELTGEDTRWFDLVRWGYLDDPAKIAELAARDFEFENFNPNKKYLPIPQSELDVNPNLVQNPGW